MEKSVQESGVEPPTSAVLRPRHNQLDHPFKNKTAAVGHHGIFENGQNVQEGGVEPPTSAVLRPRHNQLDHPCADTIKPCLIIHTVCAAFAFYKYIIEFVQK